MQPPIFDQVNLPVGSGTTFDEAEDRTRQEFKADADVNTIVRRFGPQAFFGGGNYGVQDFDMDLQQVQLATQAALQGYSKLPEAVQAKYATVEAYLAAFARAELILDGDEVVVPEVPADAGASGAATSQGEAAAGSTESVT